MIPEKQKAQFSEKQKTLWKLPEHSTWTENPGRIQETHWVEEIELKIQRDQSSSWLQDSEWEDTGLHRERTLTNVKVFPHPLSTHWNNDHWNWVLIGIMINAWMEENHLNQEKNFLKSSVLIVPIGHIGSGTVPALINRRKLHNSQWIGKSS